MKTLILSVFLISLNCFAIDVHDSILNAIADVESNGNPKAVSPVGARGEYQFMKNTWVWLWTDILKEPKYANFDNAFNQVLSRRAAAAYLVYIDKFLSKKGLASKENIIAAYNGGIGNVVKYKGVPKFVETQNYVKRVLKSELKANSKC